MNQIGSVLTGKEGEGMKEAIIQYNDTPSGGHFAISWEPLVRCKDCKHIKKLPIDHHGHQPYWCENLNIYTEGLCWFCADGERRLSENDD